MTVKNAARVLINRFGVVWGIMFFVLIYLVIMVALSLFFLMPIVRALEAAGVFDKVNEMVELTLNNAVAYAEVTAKLREIYQAISDAYRNSRGLKVNFILLISLVLILVNKFLIGFYELAACEVLRDKMSYNAKSSFFGRFFANIKRSAVFVGQKMVYVIVFDAAIFWVLFGVMQLWGLSAILNLFLPFLFMLAVIVLQSVRYSVICCWSPAVVVDGKKTFAAFKQAVRLFKANWRRILSAFVVSWTIIVAVNILFAVVTFGAALVLTVPCSMAFITAINLTMYYSLTNKKYYISDSNIQP